MKNSEKKAIITLIILIILSIANNTLLHLFKSNNFYYIILLSILLITSITLLGFNKDKSLNKVDVIQIVVIYSFLYLIITYILGIVFGYTRSPFSIEPLKIIQNILPIIIIIILEELFRYVIVSRNDKPIIIILLIIGLSLFNISMNYSSYTLDTAMNVFDFIGNLIIPTIANNIILTYLTKHAGYTPSIIYRLIFELYIYIVPVYPDLGIYISSLFSIILPTVLFVKLNTCFAKKEFKKYRKNKILSIIITIPLLCCLTTIVCLISGVFAYYAIAIGSGSMEPKISKGDAVVVKKIDKNLINDLNIGDVIVYQHDNKIIVHRLIKITKNNNEYLFYTKGDANENADAWEINASDIKGIVTTNIKYIGYPSVWLSETIKS